MTMATPPASTQSSFVVTAGGTSVVIAGAAAGSWIQAKMRASGKPTMSSTKTNEPAQSGSRSIGVRLPTS